MITQIEQKVANIGRHLRVLEQVIETQPITTVSLCKELDYRRREIRYSLRKLEDEALIENTSQGLVTTENVDEFLDDHVIQINSIIDRLEVMTVPRVEE